MSTTPPPSHKWLSDTFAETGSPILKQSTTVVTSGVTSVSTLPTVSSIVSPVTTLASGVPIYPAGTTAQMIAASTLPTIPTVSTLPAVSSSSIPIYSSLYPTLGTTTLGTTTTLGGIYGTGTLSASAPFGSSIPSSSTLPSQWTQPSNSWTAPISSSLWSSKPANSGFSSAEVHTFSDNLQPFIRTPNSNYWNPGVNPGWSNTGLASSSGASTGGAKR